MEIFSVQSRTPSGFALTVAISLDKRLLRLIIFPNRILKSDSGPSDKSHVRKLRSGGGCDVFCFQDKLKNRFALEPSAAASVQDSEIIPAYLRQEDASSQLRVGFFEIRYVDYPSYRPKTSDRLRWRWEEGNKWMLVTIKKCMEDGEALHMVHVSAKDA